MSTKKIKDGTTTKQLVGTSTRKSLPETKRKEPLRTRTTKISTKKAEEDEEKVKKQTRAVVGLSRQVNKLAPSKKPVKSSRPVTPPSSRVTKTQYFPSKKMYSRAVDSSKPATKVNKTASTKLEVNDLSSDTSSVSERPRTATLRKGSIVNNNIVGPDVPKTKLKVKVPSPSKKEESPVEYEDDFDSYESDFEEYNSSDSTTNLSSGTTSSDTESIELKSASRRVGSASTDDEKKLDSGNFELPEPRHKQMLDNIKESIEKENANLSRDQTKSNLGSLSDEGFEDGKSLQFINFLGAQKKYQHRKSVQLRRKRGEEILSMIRLDHYSFTLLDLAPVPYDVFIKNFGRSNTVQVSVQTGEDNINEEVQTDEITVKDKWTQFPPVFVKIEETADFWEVYKCNYLGVGGDVSSRTKNEHVVNETSLEKFLQSSGGLILNLQAEANLLVKTQNNKSNIPFSKSHIVYNTRAASCVKDRPITNVGFCTPNTIMTVHGKSSHDSSGTSVVCVWSLSNVEVPDKVLLSFGQVTCCTYSSDCSFLIFAGLDDGAVVVWDTSESTIHHQNVDNDVVMRSPTYSTEIGYGHCTKTISIQPVPNTTTQATLFNAHKSSEVCSLDQDGNVIVWSVIFKEESRGKVTENQGLAHWGSVIITINTRISLKKLYPEIDDFTCTDLALSHFDTSNLYISTSYGIIVHCLASGGKTGVKKYLPGRECQANCLEMCPFSPQYLLAGFDNGDINFYSRAIQKPLMVLSNKDTLEGKVRVDVIQWSHNRPLIFYTKDVTNNIHVWNLKVSDMFPICSVPFTDKIVAMKLSPVIRSSDDIPETTYMIIATDDGSVYVHVLNEDHDQLSKEDFSRDKQKLFNYIDRYV